MVSYLHKWAPGILAASPTPSVDEDRLKHMCTLLGDWSNAISEVSQFGRVYDRNGNARRWQHATHTLLMSIRTALTLKGGPSKLLSVVTNAVALSAPGCLVAPLQRALRRSGARKLPSASTLARNELALDLALCELHRAQYKHNMLRFIWCDASEVGGFDWLWTQCHQISEDNIVSTANAAMSLAMLVTAHCESLPENTKPALQPNPEWLELLCQIQQNVEDVVFTPASLASGNQALLHKASAMCHQWHLSVPSHISLDDYADTIQAGCFDLGTEMSLPTCEVSSNDDLLPAWISHGPLRSDLDTDTADPLPCPDKPATTKSCGMLFAFMASSI